MRSLVVAGVTLVLVSSAAGRSDKGGGVEAARPRIVDARVCPYEQLSQRRKQCTRDARAKAFASNQFVCSARYLGPAPARIRIGLTYDGTEFSASTVRVTPGGVFYSGYRIITSLPLPAGSWTCRMSIGNRARATIRFRTSGPTGDIVDLVVCDAANTFGRFTNGVCRTDQSASGLPADTRTIVCSMYVTHRAGAIARVELLRPGGEPLFVYTSGPIASSFRPLWVWANSAATLVRPTFPAGGYACRVTLDGQVVVTRPFTILGA